MTDPRADFDINALGTFNVLEAVRLAGGKPAVIYSSTNKVYGNLEHVRVVERDGRYAYEDRPEGVDEAEPLDFHSPYGCSKGAGDQYVRDYARIYGLKTVVFRQSCIYGTRQFGIEDQGVDLLVLPGDPAGPARFTIFGDGKQIRDTLWVGDLVDAYHRGPIERIDAVSGEVFNVGGGPSNTLSLLRELVAMIEAHFGQEARARRSPTGVRATSGSSWPTSTRAGRMLDWSPEGLDKADGVDPAARLDRPQQAPVHGLVSSGSAPSPARAHVQRSASVTSSKYYPPAPGGIETHVRTSWRGRKAELGGVGHGSSASITRSGR